MENARKFREKLKQGQVCLGTGISFADPTITEALSSILDFVWIDMEHGPLGIESVQGHVMATRGTDTAPIVRVPWNDPVLIKPVLDVGAAGVIVPLVRTADDVRRAVAGCLYPPEGIRGFGPRRPSGYGRLGGPEFCRQANQDVIVIVQIEHIDAVRNLDEILAVPGLTSVVVGSNDLSGSMGLTGQPRHPQVLAAIDTVIAKTRKTGVFVGISIGDDPTLLSEWLDKGMHWLAMGTDFMFLLRGADYVTQRVRAHAAERRRTGA
jgi:2-dehydro-3-deoxyglucarate aldolase/4-hydroxy-2-oxoheptanedioate aldolase